MNTMDDKEIIESIENDEQRAYPKWYRCTFLHIYQEVH